jgi:hypothetical protein
MEKLSDEAVERIGNVLVDSKFKNTLLSTVSIAGVEAPTSQSGADIRVQLAGHISHKKQLEVKSYIENQDFVYNGVKYAVEVSPRYDFASAKQKISFGFIPLVVKKV